MLDINDSVQNFTPKNLIDVIRLCVSFICVPITFYGSLNIAYI